MASILDVAKVAGVSKSTVSRYFNNGYVSKEVKIKIEQAIECWSDISGSGRTPG